MGLASQAASALWWRIPSAPLACGRPRLFVSSVECGGKVTLIQADVAQEAEVVRMVQTTIDELGELDILINNAGIQILIKSTWERHDGQ